MIEAVYWAMLAVGLGYLFIATVIGDFLDIFDFEFGDGVNVVGVFMATLAGMGSGGLLGVQVLGQSEGTSVLTGLFVAALLGGVSFLGFRVLAHSEAPNAFNLQELVGKVGRVIVSITPGSTGRVTILHDGMTRSFSATSKQQVLTPGETVVVDRTTGDVLEVKRVR